MMTFERFIFIVIFLWLGIIFFAFYSRGLAYKKLIYDKTGEEVAWYIAANYPCSYFTDANVKIKTENK